MLGENCSVIKVRLTQGTSGGSDSRGGVDCPSARKSPRNGNGHESWQHKKTFLPATVHWPTRWNRKGAAFLSHDQTKTPLKLFPSNRNRYQPLSPTPITPHHSLPFVLPHYFVLQRSCSSVKFGAVGCALSRSTYNRFMQMLANVRITYEIILMSKQHILMCAKSDRC